ncbi:MAG: hypothetical protein HY066_04385 [Betaproteobacteria bacterium]|nr:hypothetical protein [Betaproteobacteria bacterium]
MTDLTQRVARTVGKHFVTLSCVQYPPLDAPPKTLVFSGFMIDVQGEWFYVTAGHIIPKIFKALAAGSSFDVWRFGDQTAGDRFKGIAVPYDFNADTWLVLEDQDLGLDYAAVHVGNFYRRQLEAGGVTAIGKEAWSDHTTECDHWSLVGIPSETVDYDGVTIITARVVIAPLVPAEEPELAGNKVQNQFYAKPLDGSDAFFKDADGFSGGPVFALKRVSDKWLYGVIGVQSAWYSSTKTLAICPFSSFGFALEEVVAEARRVQGQSGSAPSTV